MDGSNGDQRHPYGGIDAFGSEESDAAYARAAQYLGMTSYALGDESLAADVRADGEALDISEVDRPDPALAEWMTPGGLDDLTRLLGGSRGLDGKRDLWAQARESRQAEHLVALLNLAQKSPESVEATTAAACLAAFDETLTPERARAGGQLVTLEPSRDVLLGALTSGDDQAAAMAAVVLEPATSPPGPTMPPGQRDDPVSSTVHGTFARVVPRTWYRPGSAMHTWWKTRLTPNLYADDDYFTWSGGYSPTARAIGSSHLAAWAGAVSTAASLDTVYAHSHGGNVALGAAAAGQRIRVLVLLHTPAIHRPDSEWAAISSNVGHVIVMRTRMDLVVGFDALFSRVRGYPPSGYRFDQTKLEHDEVVTAPWDLGAYGSHGYYLHTRTWEDNALANVVKQGYFHTRTWAF